MEFTQKSSEEFKELLKKHSLAPKNAKIDDMASVHDALYELKRYISEESMGQIWPEDIGTDQDANVDYEGYLNGFQNFSDGELSFEGLTSKMDGDLIEIKFMDGSDEIVWKFEQYSDSFSSEFIAFLFEYSRIRGENQLIDLLSEDMFEFAYVPNQIGDFLRDHELFEQLA
ncbi:hypothetical protein [uncultured Microbulbifer sp.]|uniref:hypothetical protein n=1 Tax=uncultured Microbulbifer sp. TaxID=348147 RepID=UPI002626F676|nr:hypothetical protein [uncultured Microbulbifer sp.]